MSEQNMIKNKEAKHIFEQHIRQFPGQLVIETGVPVNRAEVYQWNGIRIHVTGVQDANSTILNKGFVEKEIKRCDVVAVVDMKARVVTYIKPQYLLDCKTYSGDYPDGTNNAKLDAIFRLGKPDPASAMEDER